MSMNLKKKSISLVALMFLSTMLALVSVPATSAAGINQTTSGVLNGQETWTGTHNLVGNVTVAPGASLVVNPGTTINIPFGKHIDVQGAICVASTACGAASDGSSSSQVKFSWSLPVDYTIRGPCVISFDAACGSGMIIRNTIDEAKTGLNYVEFENAYGYEVGVQSGGNVQAKYAALVFDGPRTNANGLVFTNINSSNILLVDLANPTITGSTFTLGVDAYAIGRNAAITAYGAGAGISDPMTVSSSTFTGDAEGSCGNSGSGISMIYASNSYVAFDDLQISDNGYGLFMEQSSGSITNSEITVNCAAIDTKGFKQTGTIKHTLNIDDNILTTTDGAGITAYDQARVSASRNNISGAEESSGVGIRSSTVDLIDNSIGPIGGFNGLWIYGTSEVSAVGNNIFDTGKEPVVHGEYHYRDSGWPSVAPGESRLYMEGNTITNNEGTCNSVKMYGGDFECPAIHIFRASATLYNNTVVNSVGDALRIKGGIVNVQGNNMQTESFGVNISHHDDNYGNKYGSIGYFSQNTFTNATQVYNITESRVTIQSEYMPDPSGGELYPVQIRWLGAECPSVQNECLKVPDTSKMPPAFMPMSLELVNNSTVLSYADIQNFDTSKIHVQNQNSPWGSQVREGELVRFRVKALNSDVAGATVIIKDATGLPLYTLTTDEFGYTPEVTLSSDFYLDRNWNNQVGEQNVDVVVSPGPPAITKQLDENTCSDGYDNDGDTLYDEDDPDCATGREIPAYSVEAFKFGKGVYEYDFTLNGPVDDIINLVNMPPTVAVTQPELTSFARIVTVSGTAWDGNSPPYANDIIAQQEQFGIIEKVQYQPPGSDSWLEATDTSNSNGVITQESYPFSTWTFSHDLTNYANGEGDVSFRFRAFDGLEYSPIVVKKFKLNLEAPSLTVNIPGQNSVHDSSSPKGSVISFAGTASDPYFGVLGNDIQEIWFEITEKINPQFTSKFSITPEVGQTLSAWEYDWNFRTYPSGDYLFKIWAADSDFCKDDTSDLTCDVKELDLTIINENAAPNLALDYPLQNEIVPGELSTPISGYVWDYDGLITRVDISIYKGGRNLGGTPTTITINQDQIIEGEFNTSWNSVTGWRTNNLPNLQQYEIVVRSFDGESYSDEESRFVTIDNSVDNDPPDFNPDGWANTVTVYCDENSDSATKCGDGATFNLNEYFTDPEGGLLRFGVFNDPNTFEDDLYYDYFTISSDGIATYNPRFRSGDVDSWSLYQVKFIAEDQADLFDISRPVNIVVKPVSFDVLRTNLDDIVSDSNPAIFTGSGLPNSLVKARLDSQKGQLVNSTRVMEDGTWEMQISASQLGSADYREIVFEMDGQIFAGESGEDTLFKLDLKTEEESSKLWLYILIGIVVVVILVAVGMFFFTFEEFDEDELFEDAQVQQTTDPYAWAKAKEVPNIPANQPQQTTGQTTFWESPAQQQTQQQPVQQQVQQTTSQHPGWIWDAERNQWVPDPNYVNNGQ